MADVRSHQKFYYRDTHGIVHKKRVDKIWRDEAPNSAENLRFRNATKGTLKAQVLVIALCDEAGQTNGRRLVISCDKTGAIKYSLSNAEASAQQLCYRQHQRYWIERAIQEAKSEVGMAQYQVRGWYGWHQHIAMVTLAMLFALQQQVACRDCVPLLSTHDVVELLSYYLPTKKNSEQEIFRQMTRRHKARLKSIEHHYRKRANLSNIIKD